MSLLCKELTSPRLLATPHNTYSERTTIELGVVKQIASVHARFGPRSVPHYIISNCNSLSDLLEVAILLKEAGLVKVTPKAKTSNPAQAAAAAVDAGASVADPTCLFNCAWSRLPVNITSAVDIIPLFETIKDLMAGGV